MRYLQKYIEKDLKHKMVILGGPRQVGKTTLAKNLLSKAQSGVYFNYDSPEHQKAIFNQEWKKSDKLIIFDEIHKYYSWKNFTKGLFDLQKDQHQFLITGSARMDTYKKGGDSMLGRYHYWRLHPFTLDEIPEGIGKEEAFKRLMTLGGFPEPFLVNDLEQARRWRKERYDRIIREDIQDLERINALRDMQNLAFLLQERVSGTIAYSNLARDLKVAPDTVKNWIEIFERMYLCFSIIPYSTKLTRALQKPKKIYFFDNGDVRGDEGQRFENLVASHLLKKLHFLEDKTGYRYELRYIRDREKREVDFVILKEGKVQELIEAKWSETAISKHLKYFQKKIQAPKVTQIVGKLKRGFDKDGVEVRSALEYFAEIQQ
jgi:predicted AAA+ superfamily ATPase